jgi:hypothetical protein
MERMRDVWLVMGLAVAAAMPVGAADRPPCPGGVYEVQGGPLLIGAPASQVDTITVSPDPASIELSIGCGPANAVKADKVRGAKRGTKVRATWEGCANLTGKIRLKGIIVDECGTLSGKLRAKGVKRPFDAVREGEGLCDPLAAPGAQGCAGGQKCTWVVVQDLPTPLGTTDCVADGTQGLGDACTTGPAGETTGFDDCQAGLICTAGVCADVCGFDGSPEAACEAGYNCTRYAGLFANGEDDPVAGACSPGCNPVTQQVTGGGPCPEGQGCYLLTGQTDTIAVCAEAGTLGHNETIVGTAYANSCLPGHQPRRQSPATQDFQCGALCQVTDVYSGVNEADEGGIAPYTCAAAGAPPPADPTAGESCRYWWAREPFEGLSPYSNTVGWCFNHAVFQYDTNGDMTPDAPFPRCTTLTTNDVVPPIGNPPHNDAEYFWCTALPEAPALATGLVRMRR